MELSIKIDKEQFMEMVEEAVRRFKSEMCSNCPYKEEE